MDKMNYIRRMTKQREMVLNAVHSLEHPTAQEVYSRITSITGTGTEDRISLGTIYRNLQVLAQEGMIAEVPAGQDAMRYDVRADTHYHLLCRNCGKVFDVPLEYKKDIDPEAERSSGCRIESHDILFRGLCKNCCKEGH
ncbi:MAG: transcriptional repressor [Spirochaetaceae bacterium]|jgi:Fur family peroxide stress response transcriptional regulator|nr:transcriptional repressor [Spirochaetaceae bacterium]